MKRVALLVGLVCLLVCACGPEFDSVSCADGGCEGAAGAGAGGAPAVDDKAPCCAEFTDPTSPWVMCSCRLEHPRADCTQAWWDAEYPESVQRHPVLVDRCRDILPSAPDVWCCRRSPIDPVFAPEKLDYCSCTLESAQTCADELAAVQHAVKVDSCP